MPFFRLHLRSSPEFPPVDWLRQLSFGLKWSGPRAMGRPRSRSVPSFATMIISDSDSASPPSNSRQADQSAAGHDLVHLASLKKGLRFPLHSLLVEFLNKVDLLPCQLVLNSHRYITGYLVRCKEVGVKPTLDHFLFTFKLTKGHGDWASYASLSQRSSRVFTSDKKGSTKDWKPFFVFVSTGPESPFTGSGLSSFRRVPSPPSDATLLSITRQLCGQGAVEIKKVVTEESPAALGFEFVQDEHRHQPDLLRDVPGTRSSSRGEDSPLREQVVIEVEDQDDAALETGTMVISSPPCSPMLGGDLAGSSQRAFSERPHSPPVVTYEVATEGRSTRFSIPLPSPRLGDVQLETPVTLASQDRARISAGSEDDLNNMVLLKLSQSSSRYP
ncbi:unnamed protein product [Cuscuta campestris]|uniref:Uncharacterized protein n=1 Tax=Cuscuta campestris TaxID=132261 RepID=A0A484M7R5_9ASTE|nr:unnamed protein product [Cuscuta campestris]